MTPEEAKKVVEAYRIADMESWYEIEQISKAMQKSFPEYDWIQLACEADPHFDRWIRSRK